MVAVLVELQTLAQLPRVLVVTSIVVVQARWTLRVEAPEAVAVEEQVQQVEPVLTGLVTLVVREAMAELEALHGLLG
jgi:hypothetical protein